ncbi:TonB-dependent receptor [Acidipila sp. EB88]|uniref:TonB-dependent receptor n=1 Tax=Acidipila sp. EB88 TaxID=2305226 RepID=UPI000F5D5787|nr:TonB-dependent receptor [Acidipila sp. EB88]RRA49811.1 carboxypeptidase regulatory-like domain-containing protein [Acidipila sp. EB88]
MRLVFSRTAQAAAVTTLLAASCSLAQTVTGSVTGTVTDPSGAVIPNATVVAVNVGTGVRTPATTDSAGSYTIRFLPIGPYQIEVTADGFGKLTVPQFTLEINQTAKVNAQVKVGASTTVEVQGNLAPIIDTSDGTVGLTLDANQIATIPLNGRNFSSVTLFVPGAVNTDPTGLTGANATERNTYNNGIVAVNGNRAQANNYTLDGIDMNEGQNNLIAYNPAPDAIAEMRVITADAPATYGNVNGGDVVSILKSGTNEFHGSAYGYLENQNMNANSWSNKHGGTVIPINPYTQTQFGGTLGGPIVKKKLFFFVDYEGTREHTGGIGTASVLTAAMRQGDFSAVTGSDGKQKQLYNTQAGFTPYVNNQVPVVNPVAQYLFAHPELYPLPNTAPTDKLILNDYQGQTRSFRTNDQGDVKIEWDPRIADKVTAFYAQSNAGDGSVAVLPITFPAQNVFPTKLFGATWVHTLSSAIVNEARVGFTRVRWDQGVPTDPTGLFGLTGDQVVGIPFGTQQYVGFSGQSIGDNASYLGTPAAPQILRDNTFYYGDNLTVQRGNHLFSLGAQAIRYQQNYALSGAQGSLGQFNYNGTFTGDGTDTGYSAADFVLDQSNGESIAIPGGSGLVGNRQWRTAEFIQDDWKVTPKLTLTLGLRYEYDQRWNEVNNKTANVLLNTGVVEYAGAVPAGAPAGSIVCDNKSCYQPTYDQVQPRFGFAYSISPRWVLRGGYGATSFFEGDANNQRLTYQSPFLAFAQPQAAPPTKALGTTPYSPGTPFAAANGFTISSISTQGAGFGAWPQNIQPAYIHEFNLTTEVELSNKTSMTLAYVGETGQHLADYRNGNQLTLAQSQALSANGSVVTAATTAPYANLVGQNGNLLITESNASMNFNAGEVSVRHRQDKGFEWTVNYTYGRAMTNSAGNYTASGITGQNGAFQDGYNGHADYGPAGQDIRHNLSALGVYAIPFGHGQLYGAHTNKLLDLALGGWSVSGTAIAYSGFPLTINGPGGESGTNSFGQERANQYRHITVHNRGTGNWFGTDPSAQPCLTAGDNGVCAYGAPTALTFGTASVGSERAPGYEQIDFSAFKDFHITERQALGFRADGFNALNIASYGNPDSGVTDPSFGQITTTRSGSRVLQVSAHYTF